MHILKQIAQKNKAGIQAGAFSVCTANPLVTQAAMRHAGQWGYPLILEATSNQCNQFGGYTGMTPQDYVCLVKRLAEEENLDPETLILGGDHLGPLVSRNKPEEAAMRDAADMVRAYTLAGFDKIHIDTSMRLGDDDPAQPLSAEVSARRAALLARVVSESYREGCAAGKLHRKPVLVVGSEVPVPGGTTEHEDSTLPTDPERLRQQIIAFRRAFLTAGLDFEDVVAFVAQPGVEFGDDYVSNYDPERAAALVTEMQHQYGIILEGHSTDYQTPEALSTLVRDGVAILKVGPALTFALREGLMLLEQLAGEMGQFRKPGFRRALETAMLTDPRYWQQYYRGSEAEVAYKRLFSYSDRCRYYLPADAVKQAADRLLDDLPPVPAALLSLYFPLQYQKYRQGCLENDARSILFDRIGNVLDGYAAACYPQLSPVYHLYQQYSGRKQA